MDRLAKQRLASSSKSDAGQFTFRLTGTDRPSSITSGRTWQVLSRRGGRHNTAFAEYPM
ncbi:MAG: hypothetical protein ACRYFK_04690 [Janthinobacterium lividum]